MALTTYTFHERCDGGDWNYKSANLDLGPNGEGPEVFSAVWDRLNNLADTFGRVVDHYLYSDNEHRTMVVFVKSHSDRVLSLMVVEWDEGYTVETEEGDEP